MPKVFISHSWADNDISRKIAHDLKRDGAEIWIDFTGIEAGDSLPGRINKALEWCDTLVLLWSKSAEDSEWVKLEWECSINLKKKIIPCILDNTRLQPILHNLKYIDFRDFDKGYNELCRSLKLQALYEKKKAEAEKLKLEQERLEAERKEKEKQERQEKEKQLRLQAEQERQKREQERLRLQEAERTEKEKQRKLLAEQERQKKEQERLQLMEAERQKEEQLEKANVKFQTSEPSEINGLQLEIPENYLGRLSLRKPNRKKVYVFVALLLVGFVFGGIYYIKYFFNTLSEEEVKEMLVKNDFFDKYWNETGKGFSNRFGTDKIKGGNVVIDTASGLIWQQSGSLDYMNYDKAKEFIQALNRNKFAGFDDWRLPTLEEAMSLMEPEKLSGGLCIDPKFDATQSLIWTADQGASWAWVVSFFVGKCDPSLFYYSTYVRAVRFGQSSPE